MGGAHSQSGAAKWYGPGRNKDQSVQQPTAAIVQMRECYIAVGVAEGTSMMQNPNKGMGSVVRY